MDEIIVGDQTILFDRDATVAIYSSTETGGLLGCGCLSCQNFAVQRGSIYPPSFVAMLERLGIDPSKEGEAFEYGPTSDGRHLYGGWFYLIGELLVPGERSTTGREAPEFSYWFVKRAPTDKRFSPQLAVEFMTTIPWVLPEHPD